MWVDAVHWLLTLFVFLGFIGQGMKVKQLEDKVGPLLEQHKRLLEMLTRLGKKDAEKN
jgi:hypothetical protein